MNTSNDYLVSFHKDEVLAILTKYLKVIWLKIKEFEKVFLLKQQKKKLSAV